MYKYASAGWAHQHFFTQTKINMESIKYVNGSSDVDVKLLF